MIENLEVEYKAMLTEEQFLRLLDYFPGNKTIHQTNHYFRSTKSNKPIFRFREIDGTWLFTLKVKQDEGRMEHEKSFDSLTLDDSELLYLLKENGCEPPFEEIATLTTIRHEIILEDEATLCIDENTYGNKKDYEIEYEISGPLGNLNHFQELLGMFDITYIPSPLSKQARAIQEASNC